MNDLEQRGRAAGGPFGRGLWALATLRPYGDSMLTPAVRQWLVFSLAVVFLMSLIEGTVWATVSRYFAPEGERGWLTAVLAPIFFVGVFAIVWIVDVSFVTSERPERAAVPPTMGGDPTHAGATPGERLRWWFGVAVRLAIVLISLIVTAPFLTQAIRSDEVAESYRALVAQARRARESELTAQLDRAIAELRQRQAELKSEQARLDARSAAQGEATAKDLEALRAAARDYASELAAQIQGLEGRPAGYGTKARAAEQARDAAQARLDRLARERETNREANDRRLREITDALRQIDGDLVRATAEKSELQARLAALTPAELAARYGLDIPTDTIGTRVVLLADLRARDLASEQERFSQRYPGVRFGWPQRIAFHLRSVEGLSQALLAILFLSLIALKAFEPKAVRLYFNETLQYQWHRYLDGVFDRVPGFQPSTGPDRHNHFEFAEVYRDFASDPDSFWRRQETVHQAREQLAALERERRYQDELVQRRLQTADDQIEHERERLRIAREDEQRTLERQAAEAAERQRLALEGLRLAEVRLEEDHERQRRLAEQDLESRLHLAARELAEKEQALQAEYRERVQREGLETEAQRRRLEAELKARMDALEQERQDALRRGESQRAALTSELAKSGELARLEIERMRAQLDRDRAESAERLVLEQQAAAARLGSERERHERELAELARRSDEQADAARLEQEAREAEIRGIRERLERERLDWERARNAEDRNQERVKRAALIARTTERIESLTPRLAALDAQSAELNDRAREIRTGLDQATEELAQTQAGLDKLSRQIAAAGTALDEEMGKGETCRAAVRDELSLRLAEYRRQDPLERQRLAEIGTRKVRLAGELQALGETQASLARERAEIATDLVRHRTERERAEDELIAFV